MKKRAKKPRIKPFRTLARQASLAGAEQAGIAGMAKVEPIKDAPLLEMPGHSACGCTIRNLLLGAGPEEVAWRLGAEQRRANEARDAGVHPSVDQRGKARPATLRNTEDGSLVLTGRSVVRDGKTCWLELVRRTDGSRYERTLDDRGFLTSTHGVKAK